MSAAVFTAMRRRRFDMLTGGATADRGDPDIAAKLAALAEEAGRYVRTMERSPVRRSIWRDLPDLAHSESVHEMYRRLRMMALAAATPGCARCGNAALTTAILEALDWLHAHAYHAGQPRDRPNWWHWQIGIPLSLLDIAVLLHDELGEERLRRIMETVGYYMPAVGMTGANRAWSSFIVGMHAVLTRDTAKAAEARDGLSGDGIVPYVTAGDGFYSDGSFVQHRSFAYTGGYGVSLLRMVTDLTALLDGTPWEAGESVWTPVRHWIDEAFRPLMYRGAVMDMVRGREIARHFATEQSAGHAVIASVIRLSAHAPSAHAAAFKRLVKRWLTDAGLERFCRDAAVSIETIRQAKAIAADPAVSPAAPLELYRQYAGMDRAVLQRPDFAFGIAMFSSRIQTYEHMNRTENMRGWYTGAGATYLYDGCEHPTGGHYWPTVDAGRLPGTTAAAGLALEEEPGTRDWVGGAALLGRFGACGMDAAYGTYAFTARKAWFLFDDAVAALGAAITSDTGRPIETIIENRMLADSEDRPLTVDGVEWTAAEGEPAALEAVRWLHLAGAGGDGSPGIGYLLPGGADLMTLREARTGSWQAVNVRPDTPDTVYTQRYQTIWFDHGRNPADASYAYIVLPNATRGQTAAYARRPAIEIIANTAAVQAVVETRPDRRIVGANFWTADGGSADLVSAGGTASAVVMETHGERLDAAVADPTQCRDKLEIELARAADDYTADPGIVIVQLRPTIRYVVHTAGAGGRSFQASFRLSGGG